MAKNAVQGSLARRLWLAYAHQLVERPVLSRAFTSCAGMAVGDAITQCITQNEKPFDLYRSLKFASFGFCIDGPLCHFFYESLDRNVYPCSPNRARTVILKTCIDQFLVSPAELLVFFAYSDAWDGRPNETWTTIKEKFPKTLASNLLLWIPANVINYRLIPLHLRVLYVNVVAVAWISILSFLTAAE